MKSKVMMTVGFIAFVIGGMTMDDPSIVSAILTFGGLAVLYIGWQIEGRNEEHTAG